MSAEKKVKQPITKGVAKVPVVMQMEALECGAASLAMILAYYGKWIRWSRFASIAAYPVTVPVQKTY